MEEILNMWYYYDECRDKGLEKIFIFLETYKS